MILLMNKISERICTQSFMTVLAAYPFDRLDNVRMVTDNNVSAEICNTATPGAAGPVLTDLPFDKLPSPFFPFSDITQCRTQVFAHKSVCPGNQDFHSLLLKFKIKPYIIQRLLISFYLLCRHRLNFTALRPNIPALK